MENSPALKAKNNENSENVRPDDFLGKALASKNNLKARVMTPLKESLVVKRQAPSSPLQKSPLKQVLSTPTISSAHPALRDITNSASTTNDPFPAKSLVVKQRRTSLRQRTIKSSFTKIISPTEVEEQEEPIVKKEEETLSKLATSVFPSTSDDLEGEIEVAAGGLPVEESDLIGPSAVIPELTDLSKNLVPSEEFDRRCVIEVVEVDFAAEAEAIKSEDCE